MYFYVVFLIDNESRICCVFYMKVLRILLGLTVFTFGAEKYFTPAEVDYSDAMIVDHQDVTDDGSGDLTYNVADAKKTVRKIHVKTPKAPGGTNSYIPLGEFTRGALHELRLSNVSGSGSHSYASIKFGRGRSSSKPIVYEYNKLNQSAKVNFFYYHVNASAYGIVLSYDNLAGADHELVITHEVDMHTKWREPSSIYGTTFIGFAFKSALLLEAPNVGAGNNSTSLGSGNTASNTGSSALGTNNNSIGSRSVALGYHNDANKNGSVALGWNNSATNHYATALGYTNTASGQSSTALGQTSKAINSYTLAAGLSAQATGVGAISLGSYPIAQGNYSVALGYHSDALGPHSVAIGNHSQATNTTSFAFGNAAKSLGHTSIAMGDKAETTNSESAIAIGEAAKAHAKGATSIGWANTASGEHSTAMGNYNKATQRGATAIGWGNKANGYYSTAFGVSNETNGRGQFIVGEYNKVVGEGVDDSNVDLSDYMFIVGNGTRGTYRRNALTVQRDGTSTFTGKIVAEKDIEIQGSITVPQSGDIPMGDFQ